MPRHTHTLIPLLLTIFVAFACSACAPAGSPTATSSPKAPATPVLLTATLEPTWMPDATMAPTPTGAPSATPVPPSPSSTATQTPAPTETPLTPTQEPTQGAASFQPLPPAGKEFATLDDFWEGGAEWHLEHYDVGLPVGESDTVHVGNGEFWSYLHASGQSAGVVDSCGDPAPFPGCVTLWRSYDGGVSFALGNPECLFPCSRCPCDADKDHTHQQQYPRVFVDSSQAFMVYEWGAMTLMRTSVDGLEWSAESRVPGTGAWHSEQGSCTAAESVGEHPHIYSELEFDCLVGAPPGIYIEGDALYVFVGLGRAPGHMGCYVGSKYGGTAGLRKCSANPLFGAENGYGPIEARGAEANPYFEFRTISSADVVRVGDHYYMVYEGVRGPSDPTVVDDQFALGLARASVPNLDGDWERFAGNPIIMDVANNWGIGHADVVVIGPATYMYTATSQTTRGRYVLVKR